MSSPTALAPEVSHSHPRHNGLDGLDASIAEPMEEAVASAASWTEKLTRRMVHNRLNQLQIGSLEIREQNSLHSFGQSDGALLTARLAVHSPQFYSSVMTGGAMGAAESYMRGEWTVDNLTSFFRILLQNQSVLGQMRSWITSLMQSAHRLVHLLRDNTRTGSRRNIHQHYDLGNEFFRLFLDPTMMYSSAWFPESSSTLEEGSTEKLDRVCRKLKLSPKDHVVEIGTGWGGFAIHAARSYGCRVTTTTISEEQYNLASDRVREAGLSDRITLLKSDYRDLTGTYDKLVSIEMIEAVGDRHLPEYFATCDRLLKPTGAMAIQAITMPEQRFEQYRRSVDFIQKYIFPGGFLPSVERMQQIVGDKTSLRMLECRDFGHHYARTLRLWSEQFHRRIADVRELGFDDRFIRMWRYYLHYCEAAFLERATGVVQAVWVKPDCPLGQLS